MIILDTALQRREAEGRPIRVGMIGAGFMAQGLTNQIVNSVPGMRMSGIYNRGAERAQHVYQYAGCDDIVMAHSQAQLDDAVRQRTWGWISAKPPFAPYAPLFLPPPERQC